MSPIQLFILFIACMDLWNFYCEINPHVSISKVVGKYERHSEDTETNYKLDITLSLHKDGSYTLTHYERQFGYDTPVDEEINGTIEGIERVNKDIIRINIPDDVNLIYDGRNNIIQSGYCKYKNNIGLYMKVKVPKGKTHYNLSIPETLGLSYGYVFTDDGYFHYCIDTNNCHESSDHFHQWIDNGTTIYSLQSWEDGEDNPIPLFTKVQDGLFVEGYEKVEE